MPTREIEVAIPLPVRDPFTYLPPAGVSGGSISEGSRVRVPFRNREITGVVVSVHDATPGARKLKSAIEVLDGSPIVDASLLALTRRVAAYYRSSWGEAIACAIPRAAKRSRRLLEASDGLGASDLLDLPAITPQRLTLTDEQGAACAAIGAAQDQGAWKGFLLQGVTGSGKTEVYLRAMERALERGRGALCLVPEIALTVHLEAYFRKVLGARLEVLHSGLTDRERRERWLRVRSGAARVVLGPRSAIFAPVRDVGLIVLDEEQESSFKQEEVPRYRATRVAEWRARQEGAVLVYGSATPSLECFQAAERNELTRLTLTRRVAGASLPAVRVVDLKAEWRARGARLVSRPLAEKLGRVLERNEAAVLFLNRRGFATSLVCLACGSSFDCPVCRLALTYHVAGQVALCHYCNYRLRNPSACPACGGKDLELAGGGTQRLESEIVQLFPKARVARLDTDVARKRGAHERILADFQQGRYDILVGTQMVAKGLDVERVTLAAVVLADLTLGLPDFRAAERTFQLLVQVSGRAGRGAKRGEVVIQTYCPDHEAIRYAVRGDVDGFYASELARRRELGYPPAAEMARLEIASPRESAAVSGAQELARHLADGKPGEISLIGPAPLPLYHLRGAYRWQVLVKAPAADLLQEFLTRRLDAFRRPAATRLIVDVDPLSFL